MLNILHETCRLIKYQEFSSLQFIFETEWIHTVHTDNNEVQRSYTKISFFN